ncbi:MAG TPA: hypothetical protein VMA09_23980 [Candidatus Binataceae bacterium]|nr:hypothetical protein [Candidatus Binataceae bacterium]
MFSGKTFFAAIATALVVAGCSGMKNPLAEPQPTQEQVAHQEGQMLAAAGFVQVPIDNDLRKQRAAQLVPLKVQYIVGRTGTLHYWMSDPYGCECLYRGNEQDYQKYEKYKTEAQFNAQEAEVAQNSVENAEAEQMYDSMELMNPYGIGFGPLYGY